jgi:hypothetical protein
MQPHDHHGHALTLGTQAAGLGQQRLILRPIVAPAAHHVLKLTRDRPALGPRIAAVSGCLSVRAQALATLLFRAHPPVQQRHADRHGSLQP